MNYAGRLVDDLWKVASETPVRLFKDTYFYRTSPVTASDSFRFPTYSFIKKETRGKMFICEFWKIFWEHLLSEHHRMTASCFCLWTLRSFSDHLFYRTPLGNCLFHLQVQFQPPHTVNKYFTCTFQVFSTRRRRRRRSSYWKAFLYLKSLKIIGEKVNL